MRTLMRKRIPLLSMGRGCVAAWHAGHLPYPSLSGAKLNDFIQNKHHAQLGSTSGCLTPDTRVLVDGGWRRVADAFRDAEAMYQSSGLVGDITKRWERPYSGEIVRIQPRGMPAAGFTPHHKVLRVARAMVDAQRAARSWDRFYGRPMTPWDLGADWVRADEIEKGDYVLLPKPVLGEEGCSLSFPDPLERSTTHSPLAGSTANLDSDWAELFGWHAAEGSLFETTYGKHRGPVGGVFTLHANERDVAERLCAILTDKTGCVPQIKAHGSGSQNTIMVRWNCAALARFLEVEFGRGARQKRIPEWMLNAPDDILRAFVHAYWLGDGNLETKKSGASRIQITTTSEAMVAGLTRALMKLGVAPILKEQAPRVQKWTTVDTPQEGGHINIGTVFRVQVSGEGARVIVDGAPVADRTSEMYVDGEGCFYLRVAKTWTEQYDGPVYDFETATHTLGLPWVVHNSDSNDPLGLTLYEGKPYAYQPGISGNYCSVPTSVGFGGAAELELISEFALDDITATGDIWSQYNSGASRRCFLILIGNTSKRVQLFLSANGSATSTCTASADWPYANGVRAALKLTWRSSDGLVQLFTATDFDHIARTATWVQLGTNLNAHTGSVLFSNTTDPVIIGGRVDQATDIAGKYFYASVATTIGGTPLIAIDLTDPGLVNDGRTSFTTRIGSGTSATGTFNRATSGRKLVYVDRPLYEHGTDDYDEVPDNADLNMGLSDNFTVAVAMRQYVTPVSNGRYLAKQNGSAATAAGYSLTANGTALAPRATAGDGTIGLTATGPTFTAGAVNVIGMRRRAAVDLVAFTNGVLGTPVADTLAASLTTTNVLRFGSRSDSAATFQDFEWLATAIFRRGLTDSEIRDLNRVLTGVPV